MALPNPGKDMIPDQTALVIADPQNDFLSPRGVAWSVVGESVTENNTVEHLDTLFQIAKKIGIQVFVSPHYYYPSDHGWEFEGTLEAVMHSIKMFDRVDPLSLKNLEGSGADWLDRFKPYIADGQTIVVSPHKVYGPETNDLVLQLRKRKFSKVILAGMSSNRCVESHMRELMEQGFEVAVVKDARAGAKVPEGDGYKSALVNYRMIANTVLTTEEVVNRLQYTFAAV